MSETRDTTWPAKFPAPARGSVKIAPDKESLLRSDNDGVGDQAMNKTADQVMISVRWEFMGQMFSVFEGWFKHYLWDGRRGAKMTFYGVNYIVFFDGYTAESLESYAGWAVSTTLTAQKI